MALDSQTHALLERLDSLAGEPTENPSAETARRRPGPADAVRETLWAEGSNLSPEPVGAVENVEIEGPGGPIALRVYWPLGSGDGPLPALVYVHGGGWVIADLDTYDASARALTNRAGCIVVSVEYRHAPEHRFPAGHDDVLAATRWVLANIADLSGDPRRVAVGGESAGANMAVAACLALMDGPGPKPVFQLLLYPVTDLSRTDWPSFAEFRHARPLDTAKVGWFAEQVVSEPRDKLDVRLSPLRAFPAELGRLPRTLVITAENDPLRDQGEAFGRALLDAGVVATTLRVGGVTHDFLAMNPVVDQAQEAVSIAAERLRQAFGLEGRSAPSTPPDLTQVIAAEHAGVAALLRLLESGHGDRGRLVDQLVTSLDAHAAMEEEILFPAIDASAGHAARSEAAAAHRSMAGLAVALLDADEANFARVLRELHGAVTAHLTDALQLLPALRDAVGQPRMTDLGGDVITFRRGGSRRSVRPPAGVGGATLVGAARA
ncbi:MAG: alpha/beta hydrolase fold domain-containing protein [Actinomycetota bacterium]|nr:alpha/beta hydrolase fold domain-containing protein [Actinomycetota bacterium]